MKSIETIRKSAESFRRRRSWNVLLPVPEYIYSWRLLLKNEKAPPVLAPRATDGWLGVLIAAGVLGLSFAAPLALKVLLFTLCLTALSGRRHRSRARYHFQAGMSALRTGNGQAAVRHLDLAHRLCPAARLGKTRALARLISGEAGDSHELAHQLTNDDPESMDLQLTLAFVHACRGEYQTAATALMPMLDRLGRDVRYLAAWCLLKSGQPGQAISVTKTDRPGLTRPGGGTPYYLLAVAYRLLGEREKSDAYTARLRKLFPGYPGEPGLFI
ncbi:MAG: hypothetical protein AB1497_08915 [Bacillota bacterium]